MVQNLLFNCFFFFFTNENNLMKFSSKIWASIKPTVHLGAYLSENWCTSSGAHAGLHLGWDGELKDLLPQ